MAKEFITNAEISDILIERPISFCINRKRFLIYHPTLGKMQLLSRLFDSIGLSRLKENDDVYYFTFAAARTKRDECLRIIAYSTLPGDECLDESKVRGRLRELHKLDSESIATILVTVLTMDKTEAVMAHFGMDAEAKRMKNVMRAKGRNKNSFDFGAKSIWGNLIDAACERYGWSYQYILWGISYSNLRLLLSDYIKTILLTDEERKRAHLTNDKVVINGDDKESLEQFIKYSSWR